jgi:hypothetical protein
MSIYGSKRVEECNIIWINNNLCIKLIIDIQFITLFCGFKDRERPLNKMTERSRVDSRFVPGLTHSITFSNR